MEVVGEHANGDVRRSRSDDVTSSTFAVPSCVSMASNTIDSFAGAISMAGTRSLSHVPTALCVNEHFRRSTFDNATGAGDCACSDLNAEGKGSQ